MWVYHDELRISVSDMDRRRDCSSYEAGFDSHDPLGSVVEWSERTPARVLRRRCRSEGVERSPYDDLIRDTHKFADGNRCSSNGRTLSNKSYFTLYNAPDTNFDTYRCSLIDPKHGDYDMSHERNMLYGYQTGRTKFHSSSPTRPLVVPLIPSKNVDDNHLPKVEELLEKVDQEMLEVAVTKQPLKSILNNPVPKIAPPPGILKKPKNNYYQDTKLFVEGRRRQRASSESDNHLSSSGYDNMLYIANNMKRAKDNSGFGYSYGTAIASLNGISRAKSPQNFLASTKYMCRDPIKDNNLADQHEHIEHVLRTTAINSVNNGELSPVMPRESTPPPSCPLSSDLKPQLPVVDVVNPVPMVKKKVKSKVKTIKKKISHKVIGDTIVGDGKITHPRPQSNNVLNNATWQIDTDVLIGEIEKLEKPQKMPVVTDVKENDNVSTKQQLVKAYSVVTTTKASDEPPLNLPEAVSDILRNSLFPRVPPYLKFVSHDESSPIKIPQAIQKHLKWKSTTITPIVVKKTLTNSGFRLVKSECDTAECPQEETVEWIGIWGKHMKSLMFRAIKDGQKMNHFPGTFQIGRKDRLWRNLQKLVTKYGLDEFGIMPKTYVLPHDLKLLKYDWEKYAANNERWIIKPPASARGTGIKVVSRWTQIPKKRPVVVQRYVSKPYLINGSKFDMRLYVLLTSVHPLRIYLYKDGLARFASVKYTDELSSLNDRYMHLTNYSINRLSKNYTPNEDFTACEGHKWTLQTLFQYLKTEKNVDTDALWESMKDLVIKTIISGEASISSLTKANITSRYNCYELFGIDVLLDEDLKPWLLEVNISPSLHSASPLDIHVKGPLVTTVLNIAQFQVPIKTNLDMLTKDKPNKLSGLPYDSRLYTVYLSKEERDKHIIYTSMADREMYLRDVLSTLTSDDVRHLIQAEDELTQVGDMERIFPTKETHKYLNFLTGPRYYNRLFDAWETRYSRNRDQGIELLRSLCDIGYHLEVPPVPLKNDVDAPSPPPSERPSVPSVVSVETVAPSASCVWMSSPPVPPLT